MSCSSPMRKTSCLSRRFSRSLRLSARTAALTTVSTRENQLESSSTSSPSSPPPSAEDGGDSWSTLLPELLVEIMERVEASEEMWPDRKNVVSSACVCKKWREVTREIVKASSQNSGKITFPSCLKQHSPRRGSFYWQHEDTDMVLISSILYPLIQMNYLKAVMPMSGSTNFKIYDSQPPHCGAKPSSSRASRRFASKQICPQVPAGNFEVGQVSYKFNLLKSRGPRRMVCSIQCPMPEDMADEKYLDDIKMKMPEHASSGHTILRNKAPRWHEHLQCWCLNFHGRVTVASVKNFQLAATVEESQLGGKEEEETVLQFGKVGDDTFTMDYRQPLSAFLAFAICLTSFGTKLACE
ncbi:hypothetical protein Gotur_001832 [Gossypium turneri]